MTEVAEHEPNFTLEAQVARARAEMGPARWRQLCREFDEPIDKVEGLLREFHGGDNG